MKTASGWKCKGVVKGVNNVTYKVQGLNSKTKYQFKVQAYKKSKGKTIEEYMDELMKPFEDDDSVAFIGYTEIDGVKFGIVDEYKKESDDIPYDSTIRTCFGFTKKNVFTVIEGYPTDLKTSALKKLNNALKKADFK